MFHPPRITTQAEDVDTYSIAKIAKYTVSEDSSWQKKEEYREVAVLNMPD